MPETITHVKRLRISDDAGGSGSSAMTAFEEFLDRISPLKAASKLGAILLQLPLSFTVNEFKHVEGFLDRLPKGNNYAIEFRHPSWQTEGPWELLKQYNVATVMADSPDPSLQYPPNVTVTADHALIRLHGRNQGYWYNYLYNKEQLKPWADKVKKIRKDPEVKRLRIYFNNHYRGKAIENAFEFKEMVEVDKPLSKKEQEVKQRVSKALAALAATSSPQQQKLM